MNLDQIIRARRSIRRYQDKPVDADALNQVLEAGRLAPSARNMQTWHFTVVARQETRQKLFLACCEQEMVRQAPVDLVVWSEDDREMTNGQSAATVDCSIALSFMMLKAAELGLGTCWLGRFKGDEVKAALELPQSATVVVVTPLGWPDEAPAARPRKALGDITEYR